MPPGPGFSPALPADAAGFAFAGDAKLGISEGVAADGGATAGGPGGSGGEGGPDQDDGMRRGSSGRGGRGEYRYGACRLLL